jgi:anti-sigma factor RsiW
VNHSKAQDLLSAYLENDLGASEHAALEEHLAGCATCAADVEGLRETVALLRGLPDPEPPPFLATRVMARIAAGEARVPAWRRWIEHLGAPAVAVPLAAAAAALLVFSFAAPSSQMQIAENAVPGLQTGPYPQVALPVGNPKRVEPVFPPGRPRIGDPRLPVRRDPVFLAGSLRGAGHPHSTSLAAHFDGPAEAVVASWPVR